MRFQCADLSGIETTGTSGTQTVPWSISTVPTRFQVLGGLWFVTRLGGCTTVSRFLYRSPHNTRHAWSDVSRKRSDRAPNERIRGSRMDQPVSERSPDLAVDADAHTDKLATGETGGQHRRRFGYSSVLNANQSVGSGCAKTPSTSDTELQRSGTGSPPRSGTTGMPRRPSN